MPIQPSDIRLTLSGGVDNDDPNLSLGGDPSPIQISSSINNLFDNIDGTEAEDGRIEYRCFYVFNDSETHAFSDIKVWIQNQVEEGSTIEIGLGTRNHVQTLSIVGNPTSGSFVLTYDETTGSAITWNTDYTAFSTTLTAYLLSQFDLEVEVDFEETDDDTVVFTIEFVGASSGRYHPDLVASANLLAPSSTILVQTTVNGQPINAIAADIGDEETEPDDVTFSTPISSGSALEVGTLGPTEHFYVWMRRTTDANTTALAADGVTIVIRGGTTP